jgi:hypothetical protein
MAVFLPGAAGAVIAPLAAGANGEIGLSAMTLRRFHF